MYIIVLYFLQLLLLILLIAPVKSLKYDSINEYKYFYQRKAFWTFNPGYWTRDCEFFITITNQQRGTLMINSIGVKMCRLSLDQWVFVWCTQWTCLPVHCSLCWITFNILIMHSTITLASDVTESIDSFKKQNQLSFTNIFMIWCLLFKTRYKIHFISICKYIYNPLYAGKEVKILCNMKYLKLLCIVCTSLLAQHCTVL